MTIKKTAEEVKKILRDIYSELICPQTCVICRQPSKQGISICKDCIRNFLLQNIKIRIINPSDFCELCGQKLISEIKICRQCKYKIASKEKYHYDKIYTLFPYIGEGHKIVSDWKNTGLRGYSTLFAKLIIEFIRQIPELQNTVIIPVPPRPKKLQQRGWDQIDDLANSLNKLSNIKICKTLKRYDSPPQKSVSKTARKSNLKNKFYVSKRQIKKIPETVILIDDVTTTGATISECAKTLKKHNCKTVYGLCLFFD